MKSKLFFIFLLGALLGCQQEDFASQFSKLQTSLNASESVSAKTELINQFKSKFPDLGALKSQMTALIEQVKGTIYNETTNRLDTDLAADYVQKCELFAQMMPEDEQSPKYLFQAGETARSSRNFAKALEIYDIIYQQYSNYEKAPQALFLKAFTLDNDLKQYDKAKGIYEDFLSKFPNDDFADDTQFLLQNLGKTDDEIIKSFE